MRIPYQNSIAQFVIVEFDATRKLNSTKYQYEQVYIGNMLQAKYVYIPLRNDQGHRDLKYHRNPKENFLCIDMY